MKFAYADPPYLGRGEYYRAHHPDAMEWNGLETHRKLIERLQAEYPDGWVLSLSERSLRAILPMCPENARVGSWATDRPRFAGRAVAIRKHFEPVIFGNYIHDSLDNAGGVIYIQGVNKETPVMTDQQIDLFRAAVGCEWQGLTDLTAGLSEAPMERDEVARTSETFSDFAKTHGQGKSRMFGDRQLHTWRNVQFKKGQTRGMLFLMEFEGGINATYFFS